MSTQLMAEPSAGAPEYEVAVTTTGAVVRVAVTRHGALAARGQAALVRDCAIIDQVVTEPDHRRRGLGTVVMRALAQAAVSRGATTGVLVATADGLALYTRLGWTVAAPVAAAKLSRG
jgi:predicted GNAT family acetyltransferase